MMGGAKDFSQFIGNMKRPDVDKITGLSPVVAIEQKTTSKNPRSTVATVTATIITTSLSS